MMVGRKKSQGLCTPKSFATLGAKYRTEKKEGASLRTNSAERRFRSLFGCDAFICSILFRMMIDNNTVPIGFIAPHLLMGLLFLKVYASTEVLSGMAGVDEKTFRKHGWIAVRGIAGLYFDIVSFKIILF